MKNWLKCVANTVDKSNRSSGFASLFLFLFSLVGSERERREWEDGSVAATISLIPFCDKVSLQLLKEHFFDIFDRQRMLLRLSRDASI